MIRRVLGWILIVGGGIYLVLLATLGVLWLVNRSPVEVNVPILVISLIAFFAGVVLRGWG